MSAKEIVLKNRYKIIAIPTINKLIEKGMILEELGWNNEK